MTIIAAYKSWKAVAVIADCRVSYGPSYEKVDDCLQKLYQIHNRLVIGFSGPLQGAYEIMRLVRDNAGNHSHRLTADGLQKDVERWIRHRYRELDAQDRKNLSFVIATIEPSRQKRSRWYRNGKETPKPEWFPYVPEWKTFALRPSHNRPSELIKEERDSVKILGVAEESRLAVRQLIEKSYGFAFKQPELQVQAIMGSLTFELMRRQVRTVGGLYQAALLNERGIQWLGYAGTEVVLELAQGGFVQRNTITGKVLTLMTIWEWAKLRPPPGSLGAFEDSGLRAAIENLPRAEGTNDSAS